MPWYSSWLPDLPNFNFAIPTSIQGRFLSFILKKSLGHFLKPGQLDHNQIDSQLGSGYVQISDLELDCETFNTYLEGLPVALASGTISTIKARIPWPNPLTSTLGFSLKSLQLVFHVVPYAQRADVPDIDLSESVASVAETFIHQELSPREEAALWKSLHSDVPQPDIEQDQSLPGGLGDPTVMSETARLFDQDPAGVSVFAGLIERSLARFEFDAEDVKITLIHPDNVSVTLSVGELRYHTDGNNDSSPGRRRGEMRSLSVGGVAISLRDLVNQKSFLHTETSSPGSESLSVATSRPPSRASSTSSMDEAAQFMMSQSLATLPPNPHSLSNSVASSLYESAISTVGEPPGPDNNIENIRPSTPAEESRDSGPDLDVFEKVFSIETQPILVHLTTPSPPARTAEDDDPFLPSAESEGPVEDELRIEVSIGVVALSIQAWQVRGLLRLMKALLPTEHASQDTFRSKGDPPAKLPSIRLDMQIRGIVALFLTLAREGDTSTSVSALLEYFKKPLIPPVLQNGYSRLHLEALSSSLHILRGAELERDNESASPLSQSLDISLADISLFFFGNAAQPDATRASTTFPLLHTDLHLVSQYPPGIPRGQGEDLDDILPSFEIIDWSDEKCKNFGAKLSQWRCRPAEASHTKTPSRSPGLRSKINASSTAAPGFRISHRRHLTANKIRRPSNETSETLDIWVAPLNVRFDCQLLVQDDGPLAFLEELLPFDIEGSDQRSQSCQDTGDALFSTAWAVSDGGAHLQTESEHFNKPGYSSEQLLIPDQKDSSLRMTVHLSFVRLSLKCPSPPIVVKDRSGILVVDIRDIVLSTGHQRARTTRFADDIGSQMPNLDLSEESILLRAEFGRAVISCSMVGTTTARAFCSIGPLQAEEVTEMDPLNESFNSSSAHFTPLRPRFHVLQPKVKNLKAPLYALSIDIPAIHGQISKAEFDALQYLADDVSQLFERLSSQQNEEIRRQTVDSRDTSIIGSRFFAKSRSGSGSALSSSPAELAESVVKITVTSALFKIMVPRTDTDELESRPLELKASDMDVLVEFNPDGKQQMVLTLAVMDLAIINTDKQRRPQSFLNITSPRGLTSIPKPVAKLRFSTLTIAGLNTKETRIRLTLSGVTYTLYGDLHWIDDLLTFIKNPPGTFESVIPSDRTRVSVKLLDVSVRLFGPNDPGSLVSYAEELDFSTDVEGKSEDSSFHIMAVALALLAIDDSQSQEAFSDAPKSASGLSIWTTAGYALIAEASDLDVNITKQLSDSPSLKVLISSIILRLHLCADTMTAVTRFFGDFSTVFQDAHEAPKEITRGPAVVSQRPSTEGSSLISSVEDLAFKRVPEIGPAPDMIFDDLPSNPDYLDESFGAAAGLRELLDEDLDEFDAHEIDPTSVDDPNIVSKIGGETVKIFDASGLEVVEGYFLSIPPDTSRGASHPGKPDLSVQILDGNLGLLLYDGYDWARTRKTIENEVKEMRKRLAKIRQLVATGQMQDSTIEDTSALLFNSVHIGLDQDDDMLGEPAALIAAIDEELKDDLETGSQSSWQSLRPSSSNKPRGASLRVHGKRLTRPKGPSMEFSFQGLQLDYDKYQEDDPLVSRTLVTVRDVEILDHIKTSTWKKFLTELKSDSKGNVRETDSHMVRIELSGVRPVPGHSSVEARLRAKILPLRLYVDQDAVDFLKKFFSFKDPNAPPSTSSHEDEAYIQMAEIFPVDLKLDYKPRRVDYRALKEGRTIELMNFFHFDGAEMTLRHITLAGVTGWGRFFEMLNDLWTPDVKATQLVEVISGVAPIRSMVNVGSGVADLILLPINQYKKDGRIVRGMQKGATAFIKSTAIEAIKMGAKLATGTQVILEQAEGVLGGRFEAPITAEPVQVPFGGEPMSDEEREEDIDLVSKYARQPANLREGVQSAYKSLQKNFSSAAQTILAVPMEVYERSGNEGPVRSVIRAVPIAVLKPMIGTTEAVSKTLLGLHNTLDPNARQENEAKYKHR